MLAWILYQLFQGELNKTLILDKITKKWYLDSNLTKKFLNIKSKQQLKQQQKWNLERWSQLIYELLFLKELLKASIYCCFSVFCSPYRLQLYFFFFFLYLKKYYYLLGLGVLINWKQLILTYIFCLLNYEQILYDISNRSPNIE